MNQRLYDHLNKETNENLFYNFKHDGLMNFEKKIISGKILHERKYNLSKLINERSIIVNEIQILIKEYNDKTNIENRKRNQVRKSIFWTVLSAITSFLFLFILKKQNDNFTDWIIYFVIGFNVILILTSIIKYNNDVQKLINVDLYDLELQKQRLEIISTEWDFMK